MAAEQAEEKANYLAKEAAREYWQLLSSSFAPVKVLAALINQNPQYADVLKLFDATAAALLLGSTSLIQILEVAPSGVVRLVQPERGNEVLVGLDLFAVPDPTFVDSVRAGLVDGQLSLQGPMPPLDGTNISGPVLVVRQTIFADATSDAETFGRPDQPNPNCGTVCGYNATTGTKFWGMAAMVIRIDQLLSATDSQQVSPPLRALAALGYRYELLAPMAGLDSSTDPVAPMVLERSDPLPGHEAVEVHVELPGVRWTLRVGPRSGTWMPSWYGGVVAAVVVASAIAALLLALLLASRRKHQQLLEALLPTELIRDLEAGHAAGDLGPRHLPSDSPADLLLDLLGCLLEGQPADLRDVVLLRTVLLRQQDVYRPLNFKSTIRDANLDTEVASALMRQLGDTGGISLNGSDPSAWELAGGGGGKPCDPAAPEKCDPVVELLLPPRKREGELMTECQSMLACIMFDIEPVPVASSGPDGALWSIDMNGIAGGEEDGVMASRLALEPAAATAATAAAVAAVLGGEAEGTEATRGGSTGPRSDVAAEAAAWVEEGGKGGPGPRQPQASSGSIMLNGRPLAFRPRSHPHEPSPGGQQQPRHQAAESRPQPAASPKFRRWPGAGLFSQGPSAEGNFSSMALDKRATAAPDNGRALSGGVGSARAAASAGGGGRAPSLDSGCASNPGLRARASIEGESGTAGCPACRPASGGLDMTRRKPEEDAAGGRSKPPRSDLLMSVQSVEMQRCSSAGSIRLLEDRAEEVQAAGRQANVAAAAGMATAARGSSVGGGSGSIVEICATKSQKLMPSRLQSAARRAAPSKPLLEQVERLLSRCEEWQFDTWGLQEASGGHALSCMGFYLLQRSGLLQRCRLDSLKVVRLLRAIEAGYPATNPYHNAAHAADVARTLHVLLHGTQMTAHYVDPLGLLAAYFAAFVHDYGHPGLNNDFLVASRHTLALRYNDRSPLESHHAASAFLLLAERPDLDILAGLSRAERAAFRIQVIEMVLATDMKQHFAILKHFTTVQRICNRDKSSPLYARSGPQLQSQPAQLGRSPRGGGNAAVEGVSEPADRTRKLRHPGKTAGASHGTAAFVVAAPVPVDEAERLLSLQVALKVADIGHLGADPERHNRWLGALEEEFFRQGDQERELGLPISPLFDRSKQGVSKSQVGFFDFVALPLLRAFAEAFPGASPVLDCFQANYQSWRELEASKAATPSGAAAAPTSASPAGGPTPQRQSCQEPQPR